MQALKHTTRTEKLFSRNSRKSSIIPTQSQGSQHTQRSGKKASCPVRSRTWCFFSLKENKANQMPKTSSSRPNDCAPQFDPRSIPEPHSPANQHSALPRVSASGTSYRKYICKSLSVQGLSFPLPAAVELLSWWAPNFTHQIWLPRNPLLADQSTQESRLELSTLHPQSRPCNHSRNNDVQNSPNQKELCKRINERALESHTPHL